MTCPACSLLRQVALNLALLLDKTSNAILLGDPNETLSRRTARARDAGSHAAAVFCTALTAVWRAFGADVDHCAWAEQTGSVGAEVWHWSTPPSDAPRIDEIDPLKTRT